MHRCPELRRWQQGQSAVTCPHPHSTRPRKTEKVAGEQVGDGPWARRQLSTTCAALVEGDSRWPLPVRRQGLHFTPQVSQKRPTQLTSRAEALDKRSGNHGRHQRRPATPRNHAALPSDEMIASCYGSPYYEGERLL